MSDIEINKTKCLNCGFEFSNNYNFCPQCGQKNAKVELGLKYLVTDFLSGSLNIDSKFFTSFRLLIMWPTYLSKAFIEGKRAGLLSPLRMYLLVSLVYFSVLSLKDPFVGNDKSIDDKEFATNEIPEGVISDSTMKMFDSLKTEFGDEELISDDEDTISSVAGLELSKLKTLKDKDGRKKFMNQFNRFISISMFFIMPVAAFFLYLFFGRKRKNYYFENLIFLLHLQSLAFMIMAVFGFLFWLFPYKWIDNTGNLLIFITVIVWIKEFYSFKWGKAVLASLLFYFSYFMVLGLTFSVIGYISLRLM